MLEQVLAEGNLSAALRRVEQNKGAAGVDEMRTQDLHAHLRANWIGIRESLCMGTYEPRPVRPKPGGGRRLLGIPTVVDRLIQQALLQVLCTFLGFSFHRNKGMHVRVARKTLDRLKDRVREATSRSNGWSTGARIRALNTQLAGWIAYFSLARTPSVYADLDGWIRRQLRMCLWKQWKRVRTKLRELRALGLPEWVAREFAFARKGCCWMASGPMHRALGTAY